MRSAIVTTSISIHLAAFAGLVVSGLWSLDRLDAPRNRVDITAAMQPPPAASGSPAAAKAQPIKRKRRVAKDIVQPARRMEAEKVAAEVPGDGGGGTGSGAGSGSGTDPTGTGTCTSGPCGSAAVPTAPTPPPPARPIMVPPTVIRGLRIAGQTQIQPPAPVKTTMLRDGTSKVVAALRLCVASDGDVDGVTIIKSSGYAGYDAVLVDALAGWKYRAYEVDGRKVPVCGVVTFIYTIQ